MAKAGRDLQALAAEIERQAKTKKDYIARTDVMEVVPNGNDITLKLGDAGTFPVNEIAHNQIAEHVKIPKPYYDRMRSEAPELLANNIETWFKKYPAPRLVRTLDGRDRAFLSDKFNTLDNNDFAEAMLPILLQRKLNIVSCEITERRLYIKAVDEAIFKDVPVGFKAGDGSHKFYETCAPAIILSNSEVGFGRLVVETGVYTEACTNLAWFAKGGFARTHVGARHKLTENLDVADLDEIMSDKTKQKTLEALWLQVRDVVASAFDQKIVNKRLEQIQSTAENAITGNVTKVIEKIQEKFSLTQVEGDSILKHLIEGKSLSQYGLHAAVTRAAADVDGYDRATELEYLGGRIVELPKTEWAELAEAA
jgi:hypothetical protein